MTRDQVMTALKHRHLSDSPLLCTVSGVASTTPEMLDWFARETCFDILTTKSIEVEPNPGNREPVITEPEPGCFGNAVGLRNPGVEVARAELSELRTRWQELRTEGEPGQSRSAPALNDGTSGDTPRAAAPVIAAAPAGNVSRGEVAGLGDLPLLNISLSGSTPNEFAALAVELAPVADMLELNFSCPHAAEGYGAAIGSNPESIRIITQSVIEAVAGQCPVLVKLTPNVPAIGEMAIAAVAAGADGIVAINTVGPALYLEPDSGAPVLTSPANGGRGGMSGKWVFDRALACVDEIRSAIGPDIPLIGMGGVSTSAEVSAMHQAGADVVGIGSVLGTMHQREWAAFTEALRARRDLPQAATSGDPVESSPAAAGPHTLGNTSMAFQRCRVASVTELQPDLYEVWLEQSLEMGPGQSLFLWIPGTGEKPFAPATVDPLSFLVKTKGPFTQALVVLRPGAPIHVRGPYGDRHQPPPGDTVVMVAAGSGLAAVSELALELQSARRNVTVFLGLRDDGEMPLRSREPLVEMITAVSDSGKVARVLDHYQEWLASHSPDVVYLVGPEPFVQRAVQISRASSLQNSQIIESVEKMMMCGVGLCGACSCGGKLTCQYGTFVTLEEKEIS